MDFPGTAPIAAGRTITDMMELMDDWTAYEEGEEINMQPWLKFLLVDEISEASDRSEDGTTTDTRKEMIKEPMEATTTAKRGFEDYYCDCRGCVMLARKGQSLIGKGSFS